MKERLSANPVPLQLPIGAENDFIGLVDLVEMKAYVYPEKDNPKGEIFEEAPIPDDMADVVAEYREKLMEAVSDVDESIMEKYLGGEDVSVEESKPRSVREPLN